MNPPASDLDPFSDEFLADPYPGHEELREKGPVVRLTHYGIWAIARYQQVHAALNDCQTYCSSAGIGLEPPPFPSSPAEEGRVGIKTPWRPPSLILEADPPLHAGTRAVLVRILSAAALRRLRTRFAVAAEELVEDLVAHGRFDAISDLAEAYPVRVLPDALGLAEEGRDNLLAYGSMVFNAFGPRNRLFEESTRNLAPVRDWIMAKCARDALAPGGFGAQIYAAADRGDISHDEAPLLVRSFLSAGVDTTVNGLGAALWAFICHPQQWALLHREPGLARPAFDEVLRWESPVQTFLRTTTRAVTVGPTRLGEGEKVLLFLAAANRDPRRWQEPERFDIRRATMGHVAFGSGIHGCVGQVLARMEAEFILGALARRVDRIELAGEPRRRLNNTLRAFASLPVEVHRA
jgi:4-methoxybenzoate monooxygenase (O-demethylating)